MIDFGLSAAEARVLGALLEKSMATPEYYPLSLNGLLNACNQKSNREPVVAYDETTVIRAIDGLKGKRLAVQSAASRVPKYAECFTGNGKLIIREAALLCLLLLRGPQTVGELRGRSERLYGFADLAEVDETLENLVEMALVKKLPKQPGRKESRFTHLLAGEDDDSGHETATVSPGKVAMESEAGNEPLAQLQEEVTFLKDELARLQQQFLDFKGQFD
ncbi:MAG: YceH family protein [Desulfobulbaceae bacterium]|nr:YceH family protein [Desulfobulbaceae bacterium]